MMHGEIRVNVVAFGDRRHYQLQWIDQDSGRKKTKSSGVVNTGRAKDRQQAERAAADLQTKLEQGTVSRSNLTWDQFCERYRSEVLPGKANSTAEKVEGVFSAVERILKPRRLREITAERLSFFQSELRKEKRAESTIKGILGHLMASLNWAASLKLIHEAPSVRMPTRDTDRMKGRPITREEFERMIAKVEQGLLAVSDEKKQKPRARASARRFSEKARKRIREQKEKLARDAVPSWIRYLEGLWLSGLRVEESLDVYWDRSDKMLVDLSGRRPMLRIRGNLEKGNKDRLLPIAPEFAEFLLQTPPGERTGPVFRPLSVRPGHPSLTARHASKIISKIGEKANVKVHVSDGGRVKFASAHDLRRSFGERWAMRVMPQVLMELMRHQSISTTMKFYVRRNAERTSDVLWEIHESNTRGNTGQKSPDPSRRDSAARQGDN